MSFGASPADVWTLASVVYDTYKRWKSACGDYAQITSLLASAHGVLDELHELIKLKRVQLEHGSLRLRDLLNACETTTKGLKEIILKYSSLSKSRSKTWHRVRFGSKRDDVARFERQLNTHISLLNIFLSAKNTTTLHSQQQNLDEILQHVRSMVGRQQDSFDDTASVKSNWTKVDGDDLTNWRVLRRELLALGFDGGFLKQQQTRITTFLNTLVSEDDESEHDTRYPKGASMNNVRGGEGNMRRESNVRDSDFSTPPHSEDEGASNPYAFGTRAYRHGPPTNATASSPVSKVHDNSDLPKRIPPGRSNTMPILRRANTMPVPKRTGAKPSVGHSNKPKKGPVEFDSGYSTSDSAGEDWRAADQHAATIAKSKAKMEALGPSTSGARPSASKPPSYVGYRNKKTTTLLRDPRLHGTSQRFGVQHRTNEVELSLPIDGQYFTVETPESQRGRAFRRTIIDQMGNVLLAVERKQQYAKLMPDRRSVKMSIHVEPLKFRPFFEVREKPLLPAILAMARWTLLRVVVNYYDLLSTLHGNVEILKPGDDQCHFPVPYTRERNGANPIAFQHDLYHIFSRDLSILVKVNVQRDTPSWDMFRIEPKVVVSWSQGMKKKPWSVLAPLKIIVSTHPRPVPNQLSRRLLPFAVGDALYVGENSFTGRIHHGRWVLSGLETILHHVARTFLSELVELTGPYKLEWYHATRTCPGADHDAAQAEFLDQIVKWNRNTPLWRCKLSHFIVDTLEYVSRKTGASTCALCSRPEDDSLDLIETCWDLFEDDEVWSKYQDTIFYLPAESLPIYVAAVFDHFLCLARGYDAETIRQHQSLRLQVIQERLTSTSGSKTADEEAVRLTEGLFIAKPVRLMLEALPLMMSTGKQIPNEPLRLGYHPLTQPRREKRVARRAFQPRVDTESDSE